MEAPIEVREILIEASYVPTEERDVSNEAFEVTVEVSTELREVPFEIRRVLIETLEIPIEARAT